MIVTGKLSIGRALTDLGRPLLAVQVFTFAVIAARHFIDTRWVSLSPVPLTITGAALSILLVFRTNAVFDRYWEGRKFWGAMVNISRTVSRQLASFVVDGTMERETYCRSMVYRVIAFVHAVRIHLREGDPALTLEAYLGRDEAEAILRARNVPTRLLQRMGEQLQWLRLKGWVDPYHVAAIDASFTDMADILGGCERIKNTPLPPAYTYLTHKVVMAYCFALPFGMARELEWLTPLAVLLVSFAFLVLERTSELLEQPFGMRPNDLPLYALCRTIEIDLIQAWEGPDAHVPEPARPQHGVLL